jgi:hypothetical protein
MSGYLNEIRALQWRQRPSKNSHVKTGIRSIGASGSLQDGHCDRPFMNFSLRGNR